VFVYVCEKDDDHLSYLFSSEGSYEKLYQSPLEKLSKL